LEDAGCEAVTASEAYDGLRLFDERRFDAVFTDIGMPGIRGWELARAIRIGTRRCRWRQSRVGEKLSAAAKEKSRKSTGWYRSLSRWPKSEISLRKFLGVGKQLPELRAG